MKNILEGEGKKADIVALESIVEACGHDIRQVLNQVQFFGVAASHSQGSQKDAQVQSNPFEACAKLLSPQDSRGKPLAMSTKMDYFYIDSDMMPLMIQENYMKPYEKMSRSFTDEDMRTCAHAAEMIATADAVAGTGDWGLMGHVAAIGTIYPSFLTSAEGAAIRPSFPGWLQKRGNMTKGVRLAQEMYSHIKPFTSCSRKDLTVSGYLDLLHRRLLRPLNAGDAKGCAALLHSYGLTREFFTDQAPALRNPLNLDDAYKRVDGRARNQLLSELNELNVRRAPTKRVHVGDGGPRKRPRGEGEAGEADTADVDDGDDGASMFKKKEEGPAKRKIKLNKGTVDLSKCSLGGWVKKEVKLDSDGNVVVRPKKQAGILLKFIEGHTNAVRRQVKFEDITGPWRLF